MYFSWIFNDFPHVPTYLRKEVRFETVLGGFRVDEPHCGEFSLLSEPVVRVKHCDRRAAFAEKRSRLRAGFSAEGEWQSVVSFDQ